MLAYKNEDNTWVLWDGRQRPDTSGAYFSLVANAENVLTDTELAVYGLYRVSGDVTTPSGYVVTGQELVDVDGHPQLTIQTQPVNAYAVTRRQFMYGLYIYQLREQAETAVAAAPEVIQINWANASEFHIDDPMLVDLVTQIGKADQLQEFFNFCATL